jgi:hypothetical protein
MTKLLPLLVLAACGETETLRDLPDAPIAPDAPPPEPDAGPMVILEDDLESGIPPTIAVGAGELVPSQGFEPLGFGPTFLRSPTGNTITVTLAGLPPHSKLTLGFLFAAIDSLDGTGAFPAGDFMRIDLDGTTIFRESFANALPSQIQSYVPPPGGELARHVDLGFGGPGGNFTDSAYDMSIDPRFHDLVHTAPTATLVFTLEGDGVQPLADESWAIDNLRVTVAP